MALVSMQSQNTSASIIVLAVHFHRTGSVRACVQQAMHRRGASGRSPSPRKHRRSNGDIFRCIALPNLWARLGTVFLLLSLPLSFLLTFLLVLCISLDRGCFCGWMASALHVHHLQSCVASSCQTPVCFWAVQDVVCSCQLFDLDSYWYWLWGWWWWWLI